MPLGGAVTRPNERDYYQAMPEGSEHGNAPGDQQSPSNFCGILDVQSGANSIAGLQQHQRHYSDVSSINSDSKHGRRSTLYSVTGYIIVTEFCERLAYYGFTGECCL
eukprot:jgi/Undpi1/2211/HiC_scaffold_12.g05597.m1